MNEAVLKGFAYIGMLALCVSLATILYAIYTYLRQLEKLGGTPKTFA